MRNLLILVFAATCFSCRTTNSSSEIRDSSGSTELGPSSAQELGVDFQGVKLIKFMHFFGLPAEHPHHNQLVFQNTREYTYHKDFLRATFPDIAALGSYEELAFGSADRPKIISSGGAMVNLNSNHSIPGHSGPTLAYDVYFGNGDSNNFDIEEAIRVGHAIQTAVNGSMDVALLICPKNENSAFCTNFFRYKSQVEAAGLKVVIGNAFFPPADGVSVYSPELSGETFTSYGYLRRLSSEEVEAGVYTSRDILLLDQVPLDISPVAGIITSNSQSPFSHVIWRAVNAKIPNMYVPDLFNLPELVNSIDKLVKLSVSRQDQFGNGSFELVVSRPGTDLRADAEAYWAHRPDLPPLTYDDQNTDLLTWRLLTSLGNYRTLPISQDAARIYGAKATNFALLDSELVRRSKPRSELDGAFAVPFYYFSKHLRSELSAAVCEKAARKCEKEIGTACDFANNSCLELVDEGSQLKALVDGLTADASENGSARRQQNLAFIRRAVRATPLDRGTESAIRNGLQRIPRDRRVRLRSSTNAEDLPGLNGAGLYESAAACLADDIHSGGPSNCRTDYELRRLREQLQELRQMLPAYPNLAKHVEDLQEKLEDDAKKLSKAVLKVYASTWTDRAFLNRRHYRLDESAIRMGILVHPSFIDESANGVAVVEGTENEWSEISIVSQLDDISVTNPVFPNTIPEKITFRRNSDGSISDLTVVSNSSRADPSQPMIFAQRTLEELADQLIISAKAINEDSLPPGSRIDLEFKVHKDGQILIKQARPL